MLFFGLIDRCVILVEWGFFLLLLSCFNCLVSLIILVRDSIWLLVIYNLFVFFDEFIGF